jgi:hypothetical protein
MNFHNLEDKSFVIPVWLSVRISALSLRFGGLFSYWDLGPVVGRIPKSPSFYVGIGGDLLVCDAPTLMATISPVSPRSYDIFSDSDDVLAFRGDSLSDRSGGCDKMGPCLFFQPDLTGLLFSILGIRIRPFN